MSLFSFFTHRKPAARNKDVFRFEPFGVDVNAFRNLVRLSEALNIAVVIFDLETTGLLRDAHIGIVEFAYVRILPDSSIESGRTLVNPNMRIPKSAIRVHAIKNSDVADAPEFDQISEHINTLFRTSLVAGFNIRKFDLEVLSRVASSYQLSPPATYTDLDVRELWMHLSNTTKGTLGNVAAAYGVVATECHSARGDTMTTAHTLDAMIDRHGLDAVIAASKNAMSMSTRPWAGASSQFSVSHSSIQPKAKNSIRDDILTLVQNGRPIPTAAYAHIAAKRGCTVAKVSFEIKALLDEGLLGWSDVVDDSAQNTISAYLDQAIKEAGGATRLKPIKLALDRLIGGDVDYIQLRYALTCFETKHHQDGGRSERASIHRINSPTAKKAAPKNEYEIYAVERWRDLRNKYDDLITALDGGLISGELGVYWSMSGLARRDDKHFVCVDWEPTEAEVCGTERTNSLHFSASLPPKVLRQLSDSYEFTDAEFRAHRHMHKRNEMVAVELGIQVREEPSE